MYLDCVVILPGMRESARGLQRSSGEEGLRLGELEGAELGKQADSMMRTLCRITGMLALALLAAQAVQAQGAVLAEYSLCLHGSGHDAPGRVSDRQIGIGFCGAADSRHRQQRSHVCDAEWDRGEQAADQVQIDLPLPRQPLLPFSNLGGRQFARNKTPTNPSGIGSSAGSQRQA